MKNTHNQVFISYQRKALIIQLVILITVLFGCKKEEDLSTKIPIIRWEPSMLDKVYNPGDILTVNYWLISDEKMISATTALISGDGIYSLTLETTLINNEAININFDHILDSNLNGNEFRIEVTVESSKGTNTYKQPISIEGKENASKFELVGIFRTNYGSFDLQGMNASLSLVGDKKTINYEFERSASSGSELFIQTKKSGGLLRINSNLESELIFENKNNADPFIQAMDVQRDNLFISTTGSANQIIKFNSSGNEMNRIIMQLDQSFDLLPIDNLIFSIEKHTNGGEPIIANYHQRAGGYISSQNLTRAQEPSYLFHFGDQNQIYFYFNSSGMVHVERLAKNGNSISEITSFEGEALEQKPIKVQSNAVIIPLKSKLYLFTSAHEKNVVYESSEQLSKVRVNAAKTKIALVSGSKIVVLDYPSFNVLSQIDKPTSLVDIQYLD